MTTVTDQDPRITDIATAFEEVKSDCREMLKFRLRKGKDPILSQAAEKLLEHIEGFKPEINTGVPLVVASNGKTAK